jgi:hypothetical protein
MVLRDAAGEEEEGANESMLSQQEVVLGGGALCGWCRSRNMSVCLKQRKTRTSPREASGDNPGNQEKAHSIWLQADLLPNPGFTLCDLCDFV